MLNPNAEPFELTKKTKPKQWQPPLPSPPSFSYYKRSLFLSHPSFRCPPSFLPPPPPPPLKLPSTLYLKNNTQYPLANKALPKHPKFGVVKNATFQKKMPDVDPHLRCRWLPRPRFLPPRQRRNKRNPSPPPSSRILVWRPKTCDTQRQGDSAASRYDFNHIEAELHKKTTVMVKNIPNKMSKKVLVEYLDKHCFEENEKCKESSVDSVPSEYDFVYLPMDFRSKMNLGYAFVNFTSGVGAVRFHRSYNKYRWEDYCGEKICEVKHARLQGKQALVTHFQRSYFNCHTDEYLPTAFTPPRNGALKTASAPSYIGRRGGRNRFN